MKSNDFDRIAFVYDKLAWLIFGKSIIESQQFFLSKIPDHSQVLILGGGSGWILERLLKVKPSVEVCYLEASENMISIAKTRLQNDKRVQFLLGTENDIPRRAFNVVMTNFYLDLFAEQSLKIVLQKIKTSLSPNAQWFVTDFVSENWWQRLMIRAMYIFFRVASQIEGSKLPHWNLALAEIGGCKSDSKFFYRGFIETSVFQF